MLVFLAMASAGAAENELTKDRLVGVWHHPFAGSGHWETISFNKNGTFERIIRHRFHASCVAGRYSVQPNGLTTLHIAERGVVGRPMTQVPNTDPESKVRSYIKLENDDDLKLTNRDLPIPQYGLDSYFIYSRNYVREAEFKRRREKNIAIMLKMIEQVPSAESETVPAQRSK